MIVGAETRQIETNGDTVKDLLETLDKMFLGKLKNEVLTREGCLDPRFKIYVNGVSCDSLGMKTPLAHGDIIVLFSVIDGG